MVMQSEKSWQDHFAEELDAFCGGDIKKTAIEELIQAS